MPITVELQPMFQYSIWLLLGIIGGLLLITLIILGVLILIWMKYRKKKEKPVVQEVPRAPKAPSVPVRTRYCNRIDALSVQLSENKIDTRCAHQELSLLLRKFVNEVTGVKVQNCTLDQIKKMDLPTLAALIEECYAPEFSVDNKGDILETMNKARTVIKEWN